MTFWVYGSSVSCGGQNSVATKSSNVSWSFGGALVSWYRQNSVVT